MSVKSTAQTQCYLIRRTRPNNSWNNNAHLPIATPCFTLITDNACQKIKLTNTFQMSSFQLYFNKEKRHRTGTDICFVSHLILLELNIYEINRFSSRLCQYSMQSPLFLLHPSSTNTRHPHRIKSIPFNPQEINNRISLHH